MHLQLQRAAVALARGEPFVKRRRAAGLLPEERLERRAPATVELGHVSERDQKGRLVGKHNFYLKNGNSELKEQKLKREREGERANEHEREGAASPTAVRLATRARNEGSRRATGPRARWKELRNPPPRRRRSPPPPRRCGRG